MNKNIFLYRILQLYGVLVCLIALVHLYHAPLIGLWLKSQLSSNILENISLNVLLNQLIGIIIIPFGISTIFCAAGVKEGRRWAKVIAFINSITIIIFPLLIFFLNGFQHTSGYFLMMTDIFMLIVGVSMFILLVWL